MASWTYFMFVLVVAHAASMQAPTEDCKSSADGDSCESQFEKSSLLQTRVSHSLSSAGRHSLSSAGPNNRRHKRNKRNKRNNRRNKRNKIHPGGKVWTLKTCCDCLNAGNSWSIVSSNASEHYCYGGRFAKEGYIVDIKDCPEAPCPSPKNAYRSSFQMAEKCRTCEKDCTSTKSQKNKKCRKCMKRCSDPKRMLAGLRRDPVIRAAMQNPNITEAIQDIMSNPAGMVEYAADPEVMRIMLEIMQMLMIKDPLIFEEVKKDPQVMSYLTNDHITEAITDLAKEAMTEPKSTKFIDQYAGDPEVIAFMLKVMQKIIGK